MTGLRRAVLVAVLAGQAGAWLAGVLPLVLLVLAALGTLGCARLTGALPERTLRGVATGLALVLSGLVLTRLASGGPADLRGVLGPLLVGISVVQALTWQHRRDLQTGVLGALGLLVLGASFAPDVLVGIPLLIGWVACVAAGVLATRERTREAADVVVGSCPPRTAVLVPTALAAVAGLVLFLLVPMPQDTGLASRLGTQASAAGNAAGTGRGAPGAYTGDRVDLRVRGALSDRPVLEVPADSPSLWRSGVYADWDGAGWTTTRLRRQVLGGDVEPYDGPTRTDRVRVERRADGVVFAPGPIAAVDLVGASLVDEYGAVVGPTWPEYAVTSVVLPSDLRVLRAASGPDVTDPRWTSLPASVPARVRALGRQLAGGRDRPGAVQQVQAWLAANATYNLDSPVPGPGEDAVDRFLFVDRVGFCEQFAAAEVLLLRSAGIPARFVTGLAYGASAGPDRRTYRDRDLHAWVEVFHPGVGWVASDPTPPATQLAGASFRVRLAAHVSAALRRTDGMPGGRPALAAGLVVLSAAVMGAALWRRRRRVGVPPRLSGPVTGGPALAAFQRFDRRLGVHGRRPGETLSELAARLRLPADLRDAVRVVEQECYAPVPPPAGTAVAVLDRAAAEIPAS